MLGLIGFASLFAGLARAGTTVWSGNFDYYSTVADFDKWSWSNQVGEYQWYIHGSGPTSDYLALDPSFKNPAITSESKGLKVTISANATWNGQTMERTELIPQTAANLGTGTLYYHFSVKRTDTNPPDSTKEHQVLFFESHFTELKYGVSPTPTDLQWMVSGARQWGTPFTADTWFNFAYEINFSASTVGLWASTGASPLTKVVNNVSASTSTNSADFHVGVLRIVQGNPPEDWYISGVYVESGTITTAIGAGNSTGGSTTSAPVSTTQGQASTTVVASTTTSAAGATQTQWGQCGGIGWSGATACVSGTKCVVLSDYYYQCQ
ncbi:carbohydrate-binding module family 1 protein [Hymenopellis radicata]|nr:carbohydrate-binding module family 1 protein [Hymenopellis radicata]